MYDEIQDKFESIFNDDDFKVEDQCIHLEEVEIKIFDFEGDQHV